MEEESSESVQKEEIQKSEKKNTWKIYSIILTVLLIFAIFTRGFSFVNITGGTTLSADSAAEKALDFINDNLMAAGKATLKSVEEENQVYKIELEFQGETVVSYISKDGKLLFPNVIPLEESMIQSSTATPEPEDIPKANKPEVELYVMSFCPYGNEAEDTMYPVYQLLKDKVDWKIHYIVSVSGDSVGSLHGQPEIDQNIREICVKREYGLDEFWKFVIYVNENCGSDGSCWEDAAKEAKVDINKIQSCFEKDGLELMKAEAKASSDAGANGSPTMIINGVQSTVVYKYGQSDLYKETICSAFNKAPEECEQALSSSTSVSQGGSC